VSKTSVIIPKMKKRKGKTTGGSSRRKQLIPINELLVYWIELSKRPTLTREEFRVFVQMADETLQYFAEYYGWYCGRHIEEAKDKFFKRVYSLVWWQKDILEDVFKSPRLIDRHYNLMKEYAKKFIPRIKNCFEQQLALCQSEKTPLQDAEYLISLSTKVTYRRAAGIIASNHIAELLIRLSKFTKREKFKDDIDSLYANLKNRTANSESKRFLKSSYRRFEDADKTRNRCAHVYEGEPTHQEIEQSIALARLLQKFV
jgi:hypothetical protein